MSGVVALFDRTGVGVQETHLQSMLTSVDHRGPHGTGLWCDDHVGLGHQHLASTPESVFEEQPLVDDELVVVADIRLDNRDELLSATGVQQGGRPVTDSQLLAASYRTWGKQCVDHLVGAFAFVVWDADAGSVLCARDHMGVKPLYLYQTDEWLAVSSEVKALLALPFVPRTLDEVKIGDFLIGRFGDKKNTYYEEIERLPPAHAMRVDGTSATTWQYWDLDPSRSISLSSDAAYERRFRELFNQAVADRLRSNGPVGGTLSGGMDSSSITAVACDQLSPDTPLHTFSMISDVAPESDEREFIETVVDREGIQPHYILLDDVGVLVDEQTVFEHFDEPPHNSIHYGWWEISKRASEHEMNVLLTGAMGDSATGYGLGLLPELFRGGRWLSLHRELNAISERGGVSTRELFKRLVLRPIVPEPVLRRHRALRGHPVLEVERNPTIDPTFAEKVGLRNRYKQLYENWSLFGVSAREQQCRSLLMGLTTANLETIDLRSAAFGFEPRHPFTDKRLLEFSLAIPADQQLRDGMTRSIIRRSLDDVLPEKIQTRFSKTSVSEVFWHSLSLERDSIERLLDDPGKVEQYVDVGALKQAYEQFDDNNRETNPHEARALWKTLSLSKWFEQHHHVRSPQELDAV